MSGALTQKQILKIIQTHDRSKENLLAILLEIQQESGTNHVAEEWAVLVSEQLELPLTHVFDVLTFYAMFSTNPRGKYVIEICNSAPCYITKSEAIARIFEAQLGIKMGETTADNLFTLLYTSCVGACDIGPVAKIGEDIHGNLNQEKIADIIKHYREVSACQK